MCGTKGFHPLKGGGHNKFNPVLRGGAKRFHPLKAGREKFYPVLKWVCVKRFGLAIFPFCSTPLYY